MLRETRQRTPTKNCSRI